MNGYEKVGMYKNANGDDVVFSFNTNISALQKCGFVKSVIETVVSEEYYHLLTDMVIDYEIIEYFTDVDVEIFMDNIDEIDIDTIERILNETNIVDIVKSNMKPGLLDDLLLSVELGIEYKTGIHINKFEQSLGSLFRTLERKIEGIDLGEITGLAKEMNSISGELTPEKMLEAYANTDMFKNRYNEALKENQKQKQANANISVLSPLV